MAENLRHANCYHWRKETGTCSLNGCPCDDIIDGQDCECYIDESERPSENHVFDLHTRTWKLKDGENGNS